MAKKRESWIIPGFYVFLLIIFMYFSLSPHPLPSPDETMAGPFPSYLNFTTLTIALIVLVFSLVFAFFLEKMRKRVDKYLIPNEQENQVKVEKKQAKIVKAKISPRKV